MSFLRNRVKMMSTTAHSEIILTVVMRIAESRYKVYLDWLFAWTVESRFFEASVLRASRSCWKQISWALSNQISLGEAGRDTKSNRAVEYSFVDSLRHFSHGVRAWLSAIFGLTSSQNCSEVHSPVPMKLLFASMLLLQTKLQFDSAY